MKVDFKDIGNRTVVLTLAADNHQQQEMLKKIATRIGYDGSFKVKHIDKDKIEIISGDHLSSRI